MMSPPKELTGSEDVVATLATVATVVEPGVRSRLDAAAQGNFAPLHVDTVREVLRTVRERPVHTVFVSPRCVAREELRHVASLINGFPGVPTVAVVSQHDSASSERLLDLGAYGVRRMVDLNARDGWQRVRDLVAHPTSPTAARIFAKVMPALGAPTQGCSRVFEVLIRLAPGLTNARALTQLFDVRPSTFMSRFFRARLPSPKRYLAAVRLVYASALLEVPGLSISDVAYRLEYSSPQSFGRHLRTMLGTTASEYRRRFPFTVALDDFVQRLIVPFRATFHTFYPLD